MNITFPAFLCIYDKTRMFGVCFIINNLIHCKLRLCLPLFYWPPYTLLGNASLYTWPYLWWSAITLVWGRLHCRINRYKLVETKTSELHNALNNGNISIRQSITKHYSPDRQNNISLLVWAVHNITSLKLMQHQWNKIQSIPLVLKSIIMKEGFEDIRICKLKMETIQWPIKKG